MQASPRQIVVLAAGAVAIAVAGVLFIARPGPSIPTRLTLINVATGQLYRINLTRHRTGLPARDPLTGEYTLFPVVKQQGKWVLTEQGRGMLRGADVRSDAVNHQTGEVVMSSNEVLEYRPPNPGERGQGRDGSLVTTGQDNTTRSKETP